MAKWTGQKVDNSQLNGGEEYNLDSDVAIEELNSIVNNSLYASNIAENVSSQLAGLGANDRVEFKGSNPNLIINGNFRVNQRGQTSYKGSIYGIDKWQGSDYLTVTPKPDGGVTLSASGGQGYFINMIEDTDILWGKTLTVSFSMNGTVYTATETLPASKPTSGGSYLTTQWVDGKVRVRAYYYASTQLLAYTFDISNNSTVEIDYAKLEVGHIATPFTSLLYEDEATRCQSPINENFSNYNLLINGDFKIDQRTKSGVVGVGYSLDRWRNSNKNTVLTKTSNGAELTSKGEEVYIIQTLENGFETFKGKTVTASVKINGVIYSETGVVPTEIPTSTKNIAVIPNTNGIISTGLYIRNNGVVMFQIGSNGTTVLNIEWAKLEVGSVATAFVPRPYAEELALCQRYYLPITTTYAEGITGIVYSAGTTANMKFWTPVPMRTKPTLTVTTLPTIRYNSNNVSVTEVNVANISHNTIMITYTAPLSPNVVVISYGLNGALDAEL